MALENEIVTCACGRAMELRHAFHRSAEMALECGACSGSNGTKVAERIKEPIPKKLYGGAGENNHNARLDEDKVRAIRASDLSQRKLAKLYGVSQNSISAVINRKTWTHVT